MPSNQYMNEIRNMMIKDFKFSIPTTESRVHTYNMQLNDESIHEELTMSVSQTGETAFVTIDGYGVKQSQTINYKGQHGLSLISSRLKRIIKKSAEISKRNIDAEKRRVSGSDMIEERISQLHLSDVVVSPLRHSAGCSILVNGHTVDVYKQPNSDPDKPLMTNIKFSYKSLLIPVEQAVAVAKLIDRGTDT